MLKFYIKVFRTSLFPNPIMYLVHVWGDDRYWSKILHSIIPTPVHNLKVKVTRIFMQKFYIKVFRTSLFPNPLMYLAHVWYDVIDDRYWSKVLPSIIPTPVHDLKVRVTDLEFYVNFLCLSFYNVSFCIAFDGFDSCFA